MSTLDISENSAGFLRNIFFANEVLKKGREKCIFGIQIHEIKIM